MSKNQSNITRKDQDQQVNPSREAQGNPAGDVTLSDEDLGEVSGGTETLSCTGEDTYCKGTCRLPFLTLGCCPTDE